MVKQGVIHIALTAAFRGGLIISQLRLIHNAACDIACEALLM